MRSLRSDRALRVVAIAAIALASASCGNVDPEPLPAAPRMVRFSGDPFIERGIRPDAEAGDEQSPESGAVLVEWTELSTGVVNLGGYHLYRASEAGGAPKPLAFVRIASLVSTPVGNDTSYSDSLVDANIRYSYVVRAYTRSTGAEGPPSDTVNYTLSARPVPVSPAGQLDSSQARPLTFRFGPLLLGGDVAIHLHRVHPHNERITIDTVWRVKVRASYDDPQVVYGGPALIAGAAYKWRVDKIFGAEPFGNASSWITFVAP